MRLRRSTLTGMIAAATLLAAQGAGLLHLVSARHGWCPAHGEPVEIAGGKARTALDADGGLAVAPASIDGDSDQHCPVLACRHELAGLERPGTAAPAPQPHRPVVFAPINRRTGQARYRLAPKTSPPA